MVNNLITFSGNVCELLLLLYFYRNRCERRLAKPWFVLVFIVFLGLQFTNNLLFMTKSGLVSLVSILLLFSFSIFYKTNWSNRIIYTIILFVVLVFPEVLLTFSLLPLLGVPVETVVTNSFSYAVMTWLSKFLTYFLLLLMKNITLKKTEKQFNRYIFMVLPLPLATVFIVVLFLRISYQLDEPVYFVFTAIGSFLLLLGNIATFEAISRQSEAMETENRLHYYEVNEAAQRAHYEELYKHESELRAFRHDVKNRLLTLLGLLESGDSQTVVYAMRQSLDLLDDGKQGIVNTGNPVMDALLQSKMKDLRALGVQPELTVKLEEKLAIDRLDLGMALGCALDNAVDAIAKIPPERERTVKTNILTSSGRISICISNSVAADFDTGKMSTTKSDKRNHGYGLQNIGRVIDKYHGALHLNCKDCVFTMEIILNISAEQGQRSAGKKRGCAKTQPFVYLLHK